MDGIQKEPLELPEGFNHDLGVPSRVEDTGVFHTAYMAARFAYALAASGTPRDLEVLERTVDTLTQKFQELDPRNPHHGNFRWELEDAAVEDLNAVHFVMIQLIPMVLRFSERIPSGVREQILASVRLALAEIERIDVGLDYTNIVLKDIINTVLGGELLGSGHYLIRGRNKLRDWMDFTYSSGGVTELNSPVYTNLVVQVMVQLSSLSRDPEVAVLARLISVRLGIVYALRIHPRTGRVAGPFCRCYRSQLLGEEGPERNFLLASVAAGELPAWLEQLVGSLPLPGELLEGCDHREGLFYCSHLSESYSLGLATRELITQENRYIAGQSNVFTMNFTTPEADMGGLVFTRYTMDENWLGDFRPTPARSAKGLLLDEGRFFGVSRGSRAIGVYSPKSMGAWQTRTAAKLVFVVSNSSYIREVLVNGEAVTGYPHAVPDNALVVFGFAESFLAIKLFDRTDLGADSPVRLCQRDGELLLEIYNYKGPQKTFWDLASPGSFYKGQPKCAFYAEAAERSQYGTARAFAEKIMKGDFHDQADPLPGYRDRDRPRRWELAYHRDGKSLGLCVDLMQWRLLDRWCEDGELVYPLLESSVLRQSGEGRLQVGDATLRGNGPRAWLYAGPGRDLYVAGGIAERPGTIFMELPGRTVRVDNFRFGIIKVQGGKADLDANPEAVLEPGSSPARPPQDQAHQEDESGQEQD